MANVFISHRKSDDVLSERLATALRSAGHDVWLDLWAIDIGDSIVDRIEQGLTGASFLVLCYSTEGVDSRWVSREWQAALARQLDGVGVKLLPVRLSGGNPPAILADIRYADLARDWDSGLAALLKAIRE